MQASIQQHYTRKLQSKCTNTIYVVGKFHEVKSLRFSQLGQIFTFCDFGQIVSSKRYKGDIEQNHEVLTVKSTILNEIATFSFTNVSRYAIY